MANGKIQYYTTAFSQRVWVTGTLAVQPLECEGAPLQESTWFQMEEQYKRPFHISPHSLPRWQAQGLPRPQRTALRLSKDQKCWARYLEETILKAYDSMQESCRSCCTRNANICAPQSLFNTSGLSSTELSLLIVRTADRRLARLSGVSWVGMGSL